MPQEKPPYSLVIKLTSDRADAIGAALEQLREIGGDFDLTGEASATITLESFRESPLLELREAFERWLFRYEIGIQTEVKLKAPGLRPETIAILRAAKQTPMDSAGWDAPASSDMSPGERAVAWLADREPH